MNDFIYLETRYLEIKEGEHLSNANYEDKTKFDSIPTNCIFDKTLPGLGATYSEINAKRNSIIIEPNIPVIVGKVSNNKELLGVYEGITKAKIKNYLLNPNIIHKKILCTPEGYMRVKGIALYNEIELYRDYFCLYDECEKITQDIDYRDQISLPMNDFFLFENKAFVSATPLKLRNPEFQEQNFFNLNVKPSFDYRKKLNLITTNNYENAVIELFDKLKDSKCICIFMNSTNGINKLVNLLQEKGIQDYKAFSSKKSELKFKERAINNSFENLDLPLAKYNFFTSRFYSAVDVFTDKKPDIIILTDLQEAKHSRIDPFTNAIQIYGRFRNTFEDGKKFNSLTHISNYGTIGDVLNESEIESYITTSKEIYEELKDKISVANNKGKENAIFDCLKGCSYNKFIDEDDTLNYFKIDNFFDDERVKGYYLNPDNLYKAYIDTEHFILNYSNMLYLVSDEDKLRYKKIKSSTEQRKFLIKKLDALHSSKELSSEELELAKTDFLKVGDREMQEETKFTINAYMKLGSEAIKAVNFYKNEIERLLHGENKESIKKMMFSKRVRDAIQKRFPETSEESIYKEDELFEGFAEIFRNNGIDAKVNFATINKYIGATRLKGKRAGYVKLYLFKPDFEFD
jgi:hypothetical protein